jgi:hypothetical protein
MINVNLLPYEHRPIKRTPLPYLLTGAVFAMTIALIGIVLSKNFWELSSAQRQLTQHKKELTALQPIVEEYNSISKKKLQLAEQVQTINEVVSDRILWSRQLWNLNRLASENMWYDGIEVTHKEISQKKNVYDPKTKKMKTVTDKTDRRVLTVSGFVIPGKDGQASVSPFTLATESDPEFSGLFQLDLSTFKDTMFEDVGVREFKLEYLILAGDKEEAGS